MPKDEWDNTQKRAIKHGWALRLLKHHEPAAAQDIVLPLDSSSTLDKANQGSSNLALVINSAASSSRTPHDLSRKRRRSPSVIPVAEKSRSAGYIEEGFSIQEYGCRHKTSHGGLCNACSDDTSKSSSRKVIEKCRFVNFRWTKKIGLEYEAVFHGENVEGNEAFVFCPWKPARSAEHKQVITVHLFL